MGGSIHLKSEKDQGSLFSLEIPKKRILDEELYQEENPYADIEF